MSYTDAVAEPNHREYGDEDEDGHDKEGERDRIEGEYAGMHRSCLRALLLYGVKQMM
jgi:hypothetical protein